MLFGRKSAVPKTAPSSTSPSPFTIVELFQSQGCNSCPPTNANVMSLPSASPSLGPNALLLNYHVTYWDYLGWPDRFAQQAFDQRQREYVRHMNLRSAFTPQVIVNGRVSGVGNNASGLRRLLEDGQTDLNSLVNISVISAEQGGQEGGEFVVSVSGQGRNQLGKELVVTLVTYNPDEVSTKITCGENGGKTLPFVNVVQEVKTLGSSSPTSENVYVVGKLQRDSRWKRVVLVQDGLGGPIVAAKGL